MAKARVSYDPNQRRDSFTTGHRDSGQVAYALPVIALSGWEE